ncbi:uncharacterized protein LOC114719165 [Neltuma alba]|uniref:uncharacterized protein LOC114719165 n=1 Tax=Neltuma alba TaxID=207710 RepID=UPI0010A50BB1|nr:uncharacterized protein LOC114719165 [Prosopis alba]
MPFKRIIRRRLLSLLQPWLLGEPEFHLKLGFIQSFAVADNLRIDVSVLNELLDAPALLFFKDITVEHLSVRLSNWSAPAFSIEVHGVHVVLSFEKPEQEGCLGRLRTSKHNDLENVRKKLSALDPEGCALHHLLERILFTAPSRKDFSASLVNLILKHCHLEAHHIRVEVQFPILNNVLMCFAELEEFNARSKFLDGKCLTRGLLGAIFLPVNESSYILNGMGLKIGFNEKDCIDRLVFSCDLCTHIKLHDLQLADCTIYFPELTFSFSPDDIFIYLALDKVLSYKHNHARSARELWRLAASRMGYAPRLSLHRLVCTVSQWIHYVNAYENLLLLIGYSSGLLLNRSISKISWNNSKLSSARHHWKVISDTEERLPIAGIALARRVARHRATLKVQSDGEKHFITSPFNFFRPLFPILMFIWKLTSKIIKSLVNLLFLREEVVKDRYADGTLDCTNKSPCQKRCFILDIGKVIITVSPASRIQPSIYAELKSHYGFEYTDFHSISFCIDALLFVSVEDIFEQRVYLSCGLMRVMPASLRASSKSSKMNILIDSEKENRKEGIDDMESILWVEPAKLFFLSDADEVQDEGSCALRVESLLGKICLSWKGICDSFIENRMEYSENPSLLCKFERSFTYPGLKNSDFGFPECGLILGKLNLVLTHYSVSSVSLLLGQMQHFIWKEDKGKTSLVSNSMAKPEVCWVNKFEYYAKAWVMALFEVLPEKNIQLGVFVDGPSVRFLHKKADVSHNSFDLIFDFHEIEVAIGSPSLCGVAPLVDLLGFDDVKEECLRLEPQAIDIPKPNYDKYASWEKISFGCYLRLNGLNACLRKPAESHQFQLFAMKPITLQISSIREYMHSLSTTTVAFSAAFTMMAGGLTVLSFLDELYMIYQAVSSLYVVVSCLFSSLEAVDTVHTKIIKEEALFAEPESGCNSS